MFMSFKDIFTEQKMPLDYKIERAVYAIESGFKLCRSRSALAFSGGKDSTALWHLIRTHFPDEAAKMAVIFGNTGVEYPESLKFARELGKEWGGDNFIEATPERLKRDELKYEAQKQVFEYLIETGKIDTVLKADGKLKSTRTLEKACPPEMWEKFERQGLVWKTGTVKGYWWCIDQYGYPIMGKEASKLQARRINIDCFLRFSETKSEDEELQQYYEMLKSVKISQMCCDVLKKSPSKKIQRELKTDLVFLGMLASESFRRRRTFADKGYLFEVVTESRKIRMPVYHCHPLGIWTDDDIWDYIHRYNVPYSPLYDIAYKDEEGRECKMKRNGCIGCYTDYGRKNSHMYVLRQTHPGLWKTVMKKGMAEQIQKLRTCGYSKVKIKKNDYKRLGIHGSIGCIEDDADRAEALALALDKQPCAFD